MNSEWKNANTTIRIASDEAYRRALSSVRGPRPFVGSNYWQINCDNEVPGRRTVVLKQRFTESLFSSQWYACLAANRQLQTLRAYGLSIGPTHLHICGCSGFDRVFRFANSISPVHGKPEGRNDRHSERQCMSPKRNVTEIPGECKVQNLLRNGRES